jgi:hypothetical protein
MDHQGAGFAFDTTNMDFSNMFATPQQQTFTPADNTSGFFFADEGIDTTASSFIDPTIFDNTPQQSTFDMQHSLVSFLLGLPYRMRANSVADLG